MEGADMPDFINRAAIKPRKDLAPIYWNLIIGLLVLIGILWLVWIGLTFLQGSLHVFELLFDFETLGFVVLPFTIAGLMLTQKKILFPIVFAYAILSTLLKIINIIFLLRAVSWSSIFDFSDFNWALALSFLVNLIQIVILALCILWYNADKKRFRF
jgi:hypothetical protein